MKTNLQVASRSHSPERQALAAAIARFDEAGENIARIEAAIAKALQMRRSASREHDEAEAALSEHKANRGRELTDRLLAGDRTHPTDDAAEARVQKAVVGLRKAREAEPILREDLDSWLAERPRLEDQARRAAAKVAQSECVKAIRRELDEAKAVQNDLIERRCRLRALHRADCVSPDIAEAVREFLLQNATLPGTVGATEIEPERFDACASARAVHEAVDRLRGDPDAPAVLE